MSLTVSKLSARSKTINLRGIILQRREATAVFREICDNIPDMILANFILLKPLNNLQDPLKIDYELHIKKVRGESNLDLIRSITDKYNLQVEETGEYIVICAPDTEGAVEIHA
jgi:hypothetical protein